MKREQAMSPRVTVAIACYNQGHFLPEAIQSVLAQTEPSYELVLVDDGSTDDTKEVAERFPAVRYLPQPHLGLAAARNQGIAASRGEFLVLLDADDRLLPQHLASGLAEFGRHPEAGIICGDYRIFGHGDTAHVHRCDPDPDHFGALLAAGGFPGPPATALFRTPAVREVGGIRPGLSANADYDLFLRVAQRHPLYCHHIVVMEYRRHQEQRTKDYGLMLDSVMQVLRSQAAYIKRHPEYARAYRQAHVRFQQSYGECLLSQLTASIRRGQVRRAVRDLLILSRWYPQGLWRLMRRHLTARAAAPSSLS